MLDAQVDPDFFLTGQEMGFWAMVAAVGVYAAVSLLGPRGVYDMDRLLHRGQYAVAGESSISYRDATTWLERLGFNREFTGSDRLITYVTLGWPLVWTVIFIGGTAYSLLSDVPSESWLRFWHGWTWLILGCSVVVTIWLAIGGFKDVRYLFRRLRTYSDDHLDDGRVAETRQTQAERR